MNNNILVIPDLHCPYEHPDTVEFLKCIKKKYKPNEVICLGDEIDWHSISFHTHSPDLPSPSDELQHAIEHLKPIYKLFSKVTILESNHGSLVYRKQNSAGLPRAVFKDYGDILKAPVEWKWVSEHILKTELGSIYFCHGKSGAAGKLAALMGMSTVQGHYHSSSQITYISSGNKIYFDCHVGSLVNDKSMAMAYNKLSIKRPLLSVLIIENGLPKLVPMLLNKSGRWLKRIN